MVKRQIVFEFTCSEGAISETASSLTKGLEIVSISHHLSSVMKASVVLVLSGSEEDIRDYEREYL